MITLMVYRLLYTNEELYCYEICKELSDICGQFGSKISQNSIYTVLYSGEAKGHLRSVERFFGRKRKRVYYIMTEAGKDFYRQLEKNFEVTKNVLNTLFKKTEAKNPEKFVLPTGRMPRGDEITHIIRIIKGEEEYDGDMDEILKIGLELGEM